MKAKRAFLVVLSIVFFTLSSIRTYAQNSNIGDSLRNIFDLVNFDVAGIYNTYPQVIDFILYIIIFTAVGRMTIGKKFNNKEGKTIGGILGFALAIAMTVWSANNNFKIGDVGMIPALILVLFFGIKLTQMMKQSGFGNRGIAFGFVITIFVLQAAVPQIFDSLWAMFPSGQGFLQLILIFAVVGLIISQLSRLGAGHAGSSLGSGFGAMGSNYHYNPRGHGILGELAKWGTSWGYGKWKENKLKKVKADENIKAALLRTERHFEDVEFQLGEKKKQIIRFEGNLTKASYETLNLMSEDLHALKRLKDYMDEVNESARRYEEAYHRGVPKPLQEQINKARGKYEIIHNDIKKLMQRVSGLIDRMVANEQKAEAMTHQQEHLTERESAIIHQQEKKTHDEMHTLAKGEHKLEHEIGKAKHVENPDLLKALDAEKNKLADLMKGAHHSRSTEHRKEHLVEHRKGMYKKEAGMERLKGLKLAHAKQALRELDHAISTGNIDDAEKKRAHLMKFLKGVLKDASTEFNDLHHAFRSEKKEAVIVRKEQHKSRGMKAAASKVQHSFDI